jgi:ribosomal protein S18 acetylase RimI-like enzyme
MTLNTRRATPDDAAAMAALINEIIAIGGTTAYEDPFTPESMDHEFISPPHLLSCTLVEDEDLLLGFQVLLWPNAQEPFPDGWAYIGTYARVGHTGGGIGRALFAETLKAARAAGVKTIDATIRADNTGGLAFYGRLGFVDYDRKVGVPLKNGTPVDRVRKRFDL